METCLVSLVNLKPLKELLGGNVLLVIDIKL